MDAGYGNGYGNGFPAGTAAGYTGATMNGVPISGKWAFVILGLALAFVWWSSTRKPSATSRAEKDAWNQKVAQQNAELRQAMERNRPVTVVSTGAAAVPVAPVAPVAPVVPVTPVAAPPPPPPAPVDHRQALAEEMINNWLKAGTDVNNPDVSDGYDLFCSGPIEAEGAPAWMLPYIDPLTRKCAELLKIMPPQ